MLRTLYRLKSRYQIFAKFVVFKPWYFLSAAILVVQFLPWSSVMVPVLGAIAFAFAIFSFAHDTREFAKGISRIAISPDSIDLDLFRFPRTYRDDCEVFKFHEHRAVFSPSTNAAIDQLTQIPISRIKRPYELPESVYEIAPELLVRAYQRCGILFNDRKVRLIDDFLTQIPPQNAQVQRTDYFSGVCTNEISSSRISEVGKTTDFLGSELMSCNGIILPMNQSLCSNHVGVNTFAITTDDMVIMPRQTDHTAQSSGKLVPSGSGSADFRDLRGKTLFRDFVIRAMERELREECALYANAVKETRLIGFARDLNRGGKPEFFGWTQLNISSHEFTRKVAASEKPFIHTLRLIPLDTLAELLKQQGKDLSRSFHLNALFVLEVFRNEGARYVAGTKEMSQ